MKEKIKNTWNKTKEYVCKNSLNIILLTNMVGGIVLTGAAIYGRFLENKKTALEIASLKK